MAPRRGNRRTIGRTAECAVREEMGDAVGAAQEMPMCRHVNPISTGIGCCSVEQQLWELNQVLDYQNKILAELLRAVREQ